MTALSLGEVIATMRPVLAATVPRYGRPVIRVLNHCVARRPLASLKISTSGFLGRRVAELAGTTRG